MASEERDAAAINGTNRTSKSTRRSLKQAVRDAVRSVRLQHNTGSVDASDAVGPSPTTDPGEIHPICTVDIDREGALDDEPLLRAISEVGSAAVEIPVTAIRFDRKAFAALQPGEDPVDTRRPLRPDTDRFVLCGAGDVEIKRFTLLEDAMKYARSKHGNNKTVIYALKSGRPMAFNAPNGGNVRTIGAALRG